MEPIVGAINAEGEWSALLSGMYTIEEADFMAQLIGNSSSTFWPSHGANNEGSYHIGTYSCGGSGSSIFVPSSSSQESFYLSDNNSNNNKYSSISMDCCMGDANCNTSSYLIDQGDECLNNKENISDIGTKPERGFPETAIEEKLNNPSENLNKRSRNAIDVQKNKRNVRTSKKNQKNAAVSGSNNEEDNENNKSTAGLNRLQPSNSCYSEEEWNASQDQNGGEASSMSSKGIAALNVNGKTRASRGSATDPQSLYARKRRERINERLGILQNLIPNGTKVDMSTMLEEAVQYVKFLQLQIKLLSSDDLWMYAPIACNGMNIGLDHLKLAAASKLS